MQVFLDIGAGVGLFSLAAASRGHKAIAFELSPNSLRTFNASVQYNGFQRQIDIQEVGFSNPPGCMRWVTSQPFQVLVMLWQDNARLGRLNSSSSSLLSVSLCISFCKVGVCHS